MFVSCPSCSAGGSIDGPQFEARGRFEGLPVFKCLACGSGLQVKNPGRAILSKRVKARAISSVQWQRMQDEWNRSFNTAQPAAGPGTQAPTREPHWRVAEGIQLSPEDQRFVDGLNRMRETNQGRRAKQLEELIRASWDAVSAVRVIGTLFDEIFGSNPLGEGGLGEIMDVVSGLSTVDEDSEILAGVLLAISFAPEDYEIGFHPDDIAAVGASLDRPVWGDGAETVLGISPTLRCAALIDGALRSSRPPVALFHLQWHMAKVVMALTKCEALFDEGEPDALATAVSYFSRPSLVEGMVLEAASLNDLNDRLTEAASKPSLLRTDIAPAFDEWADQHADDPSLDDLVEALRGVSNEHDRPDDVSDDSVQTPVRAGGSGVGAKCTRCGAPEYGGSLFGRAFCPECFAIAEATLEDGNSALAAASAALQDAIGLLTDPTPTDAPEEHP